MKVVFMGTPEIAAGVLKSLIESRHEVAGVVTQTDKPNKRGNGIEFSDVKKVALENSIPVYQPEKASDPDFVEKELKRINPDIIVVAAYGQLLKENVLNLPKYGCINVHASLLPKYRGASPIQWAVINGEKETGVTIMHMAKGLDTGDMIIAEKLELAPDETAGSLHDRLRDMAGAVLIRALDLLEAGTAPRIPQNEEEATYVSIFKKSMGELDFSKNAEELERLIRGLIPWPGAYSYVDGKMLKFWKTVVSSDCDECCGQPGRIIVNRDRLFIETGNGALEILELQLEGKKRMITPDFLRGYKLETGTVCGNGAVNG